MPLESQAQDFVIKITDGPREGESVILAGRALPYRGVSFEVQQRVKTVYYPGNPVASQQVLGPVESSTVIQGMWKDRFLGNGMARSLHDTFREITRMGFSVEVSWCSGKDPESGVDTYPALVRRGIIKRFKPTWDRPQDCAWEIEFEWRGDGQSMAAPFTSLHNDRDGFDETAGKFNDTLDVVSAFYQSPLFQVIAFPSQIESAVTSALAVVGTATSAIDAASNAAKGINDLPANTVERVTAACRSAAGAFRSLVTSTLQLNPVATIPRDYGLAMLAFKDQTFGLFSSCDDANESATTTANSLEASQQPVILAEVYPIPGTDLRDVAFEFYGDADLWTVIANYNGLSSSIVPMSPSAPADTARAPIRIPVRSQSAVSADRLGY